MDNINTKKQEKMKDLKNKKKLSKLIFQTIIPDTSVIIEQEISRLIKEKKIIFDEILIHEAVLSELSHQANQNKTSGFVGLEELKEIKNLSEKNNYKYLIVGRNPNYHEIKYAKSGDIDKLILDLAYDEGAVLVTADKVQAKVAEAKNIDVFFIETKLKNKYTISDFFDKTTMSVHLKQDCKPIAKKGSPKKWDYVIIRDKELTKYEIQELVRKIIIEANKDDYSFVEIEREGSTIVQLRDFRIVITNPPFSDGWEITAVRPIKKLTIEDYHLDEKLLTRIKDKAQGILIAGSPGAGKSTFVQAIAEFFYKNGKIIKTVESPRDLVLPNEITQYAISHGSSQEIHDILLLSRPDYTIFDEMRNTSDFKLFADMRLSGVGMIGVIHATNPIDAIQRFVGRIELGVIPHVIDTVIFIDKGNISKVLTIEIVVKVPFGMSEEDLARPIVIVKDFINNKIEFEMYSYGEETVVIPVDEKPKKSAAMIIANKALSKEIKKYVKDAKIEMINENQCILYVKEKEIPKIIGKQGKNIDKLEKQLNIKIEVKPLSEYSKNKLNENTKNIEYDYRKNKNHIILYVDPEYENKMIDIFIDDELLTTAKVGKTGKIKLKINHFLGSSVLTAIDQNKLILKESKN